MIQIEKLSKSFKKSKVLEIDNLTISEGEFIGLVGNNGAGKTTLLSIILDLVKPDTGKVLIDKKEVKKYEDWKIKLGAYFDESFLIGYLSPEEYFYLVGQLKGVTKNEIDSFIANYSTFFNAEILSQKKYIYELSKGNQKKVGLIASLIGNPTIVIWDEPFANLDPSSQIQLKEIVLKYRNRNMVFLISSHDLQYITDISTRILLIEKGKIIQDKIIEKETLRHLLNYFSNINV